MHWSDAMLVAAVSHGAAALAFAWLAAALLRRGWRVRRHTRAFAAAALATALWAACVALAPLASEASGWKPMWASSAAPSAMTLWLMLAVPEALRDACWLVLLLTLSGVSRRLLAWAFLLPAAALLVAGAPLTGWPAAAPELHTAILLAMSVLGMLLVEHVYRSARENARWGIKFACLGIGALFAYDFYLYADAMLFRHVNADIWSARGMVNALSAPLLALAARRNPVWTPALQLSRQIMFRSAALLGAALYLLAMAASAWYLRYVGGAWGALMQLASLCGAALLLAAVLFSGAMRARLRLFIGKHFYQGRYDYREEWQRLTLALASDAGDLSERAIQAMARLVESPAGTLWLHRDGDKYRPAARWNMPLPEAEEHEDGPLCRFLLARAWVIDVPECGMQPASHDDLELPPWTAEVWLIIPLMLERSLFGFICLVPPRTHLQLNWEIRDVLKIAGSQAASYLAHRQSADSLAVARQFESYNRMSTFIVHDLKNLVSQLSLLMANAERHRANPDFQDDMVETLSHLLGKMKHMLRKLQREPAADSAERLQLDKLLKRAVQAWSHNKPRPTLELDAAGVTVLADGQRLERVINHLLQNAVEATPRTGRIAVRMLEREGAAVIELSDTGHGMSEQFIRDGLFQPFVSTKSAGMGIGVFESREYLRELGGQLQVSSAPSQGTTFRVTLPLHRELIHGEK